MSLPPLLMWEQVKSGENGKYGVKHERVGILPLHLALRS